jgi:hypothetical protein
MAFGCICLISNDYVPIQFDPHSCHCIGIITDTGGGERDALKVTLYRFIVYFVVVFACKHASYRSYVMVFSPRAATLLQTGALRTMSSVRPAAKHTVAKDEIVDVILSC